MKNYVEEKNPDEFEKLLFMMWENGKFNSYELEKLNELWKSQK